MGIVGGNANPIKVCKLGGASGKARMTRTGMQEREELNWDFGATGKNHSFKKFPHPLAS